MANKIIEGNQELAKKIKNRRLELNLTIQEAAEKANVGIKTWYRYESGEAIRKDKYAGVCRALKWSNVGEDATDDFFTIKRQKQHQYWSTWLEQNLGVAAAISFVCGSEILIDHLEEELEALSSKPKGTHIGETNISWIVSILPKQFLMEYTYEFIYLLYTTTLKLCMSVKNGREIIAHSVLEELILYLIVEESAGLMEEFNFDKQVDGDWEEWIYDIFEDDDLLMYLYSNNLLDESCSYHFSHWRENQFWANDKE